jgi:hypothetical protein
MYSSEQAEHVENELRLKLLKCSRIKCNAGREIFANYHTSGNFKKKNH